MVRDSALVSTRRVCVELKAAVARRRTRSRLERMRPVLISSSRRAQFTTPAPASALRHAALASASLSTGRASRAALRLCRNQTADSPPACRSRAGSRVQLPAALSSACRILRMPVATMPARTHASRPAPSADTRARRRRWQSGDEPSTRPAVSRSNSPARSNEESISIRPRRSVRRQETPSAPDSRRMRCYYRLRIAIEQFSRRAQSSLFSSDSTMRSVAPQQPARDHRRAGIEAQLAVADFRRAPLRRYGIERSGARRCVSTAARCRPCTRPASAPTACDRS